MVNFEKLLHLVFPSECVYCGRLSDDRIHGFCNDCYNSLPIYLKKTGYTRYIFEYDKKMARVLKRVKYGGKPGAIKMLAGLLGSLLLEEGIRPDFVTFVPMHKKEIGERGYNQSGIAARKIAGILGVPCKGKTPLKIRETKRQADLNKYARSNNLSGAFKTNEAMVRGKYILLVDDIITTGSTLNECKNTLMTAGAQQVVSAVIAKTPHNRKNNRRTAGM